MSVKEFVFDMHVKQRKLELSKYVLKRNVVYLDTNFWLLLRDVELGKRNDSLSHEFHDLITSLSSRKLCLFPVSESTLMEVLKQSDEVTLNKTITLIDKLSQGIALAFIEERTYLEVSQFIYEKANKSTHSSIELVWTKIPFVLGSAYSSPQKSLISQELLFDYQWNLSLRKVMDIIKQNDIKIDTNFKDISKSLNKGKFSHTQENSSFKQMFMSEVGGIIESHQNLITDVFKLYHTETGNLPTSDTKYEQEIINMFYNLFKLNKITTELPSFRIPAGLHSTIRWDKSQNYQANDTLDIGHATAALPYCDFFFTERRLAHLITQKVTAYDKLYQCRVESSVKDAIKALKEIKS